MKKFTIILLLLLVLGGLALPALASPIFPDVKTGHWAEKDIAKMKAKGVVAGFADGYHPLEAVTREQAIVTILKTMGKAEDVYGKRLPPDFKNPQSVSPWAKESVALAAELGLLSEEDLKDFRPKEAAKRYEIAIFVAKALGYRGGEDLQLGFLDEKQIPLKAKSYIGAVVEAGIMSGLNDNTFRPHDPLNRAQMASLLRALDQKLGRLSEGTIYGRIFAVSAGDYSLLLETDNGLIETIPLAKDCYIHKGKRIDLTGLDHGDKLEIILNDKGEAVYLEKIAETEVSEHKISGIITLITRTPSTTLRILTADGKSKNYTLADNTVILIDGIKSQAAKLSVGHNVTLTLAGNQVAKLEVIAKQAGDSSKEGTETTKEKHNSSIQSYLSGEIVDLDSAKKTINLKVAGENSLTDIILDLSTVLLKRVKPITFAELSRGDQIIVVGSYDGKKFIATSLVVLDQLD